MFPRPIEKSGPVAKTAYQAFLPVALVPLAACRFLAIFVTSIRGAARISTRATSSAWPSEFALLRKLLRRLHPIRSRDLYAELGF